MSQCKYCKFFDAIHDGFENGYCKRYAPKPFALTDKEIVEWSFPFIKSSNWCGEFTEAENIEDKNVVAA